jgi:hypothetical protein
VPHLREIKPQIASQVPPEDVRVAMRAWKAGTASAEQQRRAYAFVVDELAGINQIVNAMPGEESVVNWRQGCRYVGLQIEFAARVVVDKPEEAEPRPRTMTGRQGRRDRGKS